MPFGKIKSRRYYESKAMRSYWSIHVEAWLRSGVSRAQYCRDHRLAPRVMLRWMKVLEAPIPRRRSVGKEALKRSYSRLPRPQTLAFKAFWLMHAEAQRGSGLNPTEYANAHRIPVRRMRRESRAFAGAPAVKDWRELMHPRNRLYGAYRANLREERRENPSSPPAPTAAVALTKVGTPRKRRQYSHAQRLAIVLEFADSATDAASVAKRYGVSVSMLYRWRAQLGVKPKEYLMLSTARVIDKPARGRPKAPPLIVQGLLRQPPGTMRVELADGRVVFAPEGSDPKSVEAYVSKQELSP